MRDGTSSAGNFTARTQFFQTAHGKTIMGGYLSRVAARSVAEMRANPVLDALIVLSENRALRPGQLQAMTRNAGTFLRANNIVSGTKTGASVRYAVRDPLIADLLDVARRMFNNHLVGTQDLLKTLKREQRAR